MASTQDAEPSLRPSFHSGLAGLGFELGSLRFACLPRLERSLRFACLRSGRRASSSSLCSDLRGLALCRSAPTERRFKLREPSRALGFPSPCSELSLRFISSQVAEPSLSLVSAPSSEPPRSTASRSRKNTHSACATTLNIRRIRRRKRSAVPLAGSRRQ